MDETLVFLYLSATVNSAIVNMGVYISFQDPAFSSFEYISGMGLLDHMVLLFSVFLRKRTIFELYLSNHTGLCSHMCIH